MPQQQRTRTAQKEQSGEKDFQKDASCFFENLCLVSWDFESFTIKDNGEEETRDKVVALFSADGGKGKFVAFDLFGDVMDAWDKSQPADGCLFDIHANVSSNFIPMANRNGGGFYSHRIKCWKFSETGSKSSSSESGGRTRKK